MLVCSHSGTSTTDAKMAPNATAVTPSVTEKARLARTPRLTIGLRSVASQMTKAASPISVTISSATTNWELNQSLSWPTPSMVCSAPTQTISSASPVKSIASFFVAVSYGVRIVQAPKAMTAASGALM